MQFLGIIGSVAGWAKGFFGMAFLVCAAVSLALLAGELIWYRIRRKKGGGK